MENDEEEINDNAFTPVEIILAFIIPFILFWGGMLAPVFTDSIYLWCLSLIPFYAYLFFGFMFLKEKKSGLWGSNALLSFLTSILLTVLIFIVPQNWETVLNICRLGLLNLIVSFFFLFILFLIYVTKDNEFARAIISFFWW